MSSISKISIPLCALVVLFLFGAVPSSSVTEAVEAAVADIKYKSVSTVKLAGAAGKAVNFLARLGGGSTEMAETTYLKGNKMLRESDESSTLIDLDTGSMVTIDHKRKTYSVMTFDEMREQMERVSQDMREAIDEGIAEGADEDSDVPADNDDDPQVTDTEFTFDFDVDQPGTKSNINGSPAERFLMTLTVEGSGTVEEDGQEETYEGTMVIASDLWLSTDLQGYEEVEEFNRRFAEQFGEAMMASADMSGLGDALQQAFAGDARIKEGMEKAQEEVAQMEGVEVKNTTYFVLVAPDETFNADMVFGSVQAEAEVKEEKPKRGLFARAAKMAKQAAAAAEEPREEEQGEEATQAVILTVTSEIQEFSTTSLPDAAFEIPSGYKQVALGDQ